MRPVVSDQRPKSMPIELSSLLASPSVTPAVSHESNSESGDALKSAGLTPPTCTPYGGAACFAAGIISGLVRVPKIVYRLVAPADSVRTSR